eukprot:gene24441-32890_t
MSEFHSDTKPTVGLRRNLSNASLSISTTIPSSSDYVRRELDSSLSLSSVAAVVPHDGTFASPVQLSAEYVASARQHKPLRDRLLQLDQQNELNTIKLVALREEKEKRSDQFRRELAEAEKDYFMRQNAELRQTLDKKNIEIAEFVELITNLNETLQSDNKEKAEQLGKVEADLVGCKKQIAEADAK